MVLAALLGGGTPTLGWMIPVQMMSFCGSGIEVNGAKIEATGLKIDNVNVNTGGGGGGQGMDERAGQKAGTEYPGEIDRHDYSKIGAPEPAKRRCTNNGDVCW